MRCFPCVDDASERLAGQVMDRAKEHLTRQVGRGAVRASVEQLYCGGEFGGVWLQHEKNITLPLGFVKW